MNQNWIDKIEEENRLKEKKNQENNNKIIENAKILTKSGLTESIKKICDEANQRLHLNLDFQIESTNNIVSRIIVNEQKIGHGGTINQFIIEANTEEIRCRFNLYLTPEFVNAISDEGLGNWAEYEAEWNCETNIDPTVFTEEDINESLQYILGKGGKPKIMAKAPESKSCFIATAIYGSELASQVQFFKFYRDTTLSKSILGKIVIKIYYVFSPSIAIYIQSKRTLKKFLRKLFNKLIIILKLIGSSPN